MGVDGGVAYLFDSVAISACSWPFDAFAGLEVEERHLRAVDRFRHMNIVPCPYRYWDMSTSLVL